MLKGNMSYLLWNVNLHYRVHKSPPLGPIFTIQFEIILSSTLWSPKWSPFLIFPTEILDEFITTLKLATCPTHHIIPQGDNTVNITCIGILRNIQLI